MENKKDITATILHLYLKKYIGFNNGLIVIVNSNSEGLTPSEKLVLDSLVKNQKVDAKKLKEASINEAINDGYLLNGKEKKRVIEKFMKFLIIFLIGVYIFTKLNPLYDDIFNNFSDVMDNVIGVYSIEAIPNAVITILLIAFAVINIFTIIFLPIYALIYLIVLKVSQSKFKRTKSFRFSD